MTYAGWALGAGRAAARDIMLDQCQVTRPTGAPGAIDPVTGDRAPAPTTTVYGPTLQPHQGRCKVQTYEPHEAARKSGEHVYIEQRYHLHLPVGTPQIRVGDTVTVTAATHDPLLVGKIFRVAGTHHKSLATAQRLLLDEITG